MPESAYSQAVREAQASNLNDAIIETIILRFSGFPSGAIYLVKNTENLTLTLTDGVTQQLFTAISMSIKLPSRDTSGGSALDVTIDNTGVPIRDYIKLLEASEESLQVEYMVYLQSDYTPQLTSPVVAENNSIQFNDGAIILKNNIADIVNRPFADYFYTRNQFPGLGNTV